MPLALASSRAIAKEASAGLSALSNRQSWWLNMPKHPRSPMRQKRVTTSDQKERMAARPGP